MSGQEWNIFPFMWGVKLLKGLRIFILSASKTYYKIPAF